MVSSSGRKELFIVSVIGIFGVILSVYLIYDHIKDDDASFCDMGSHISCSKVRRSSFSEILNVPIAVFGLLYNIVTVLVGLVGIQMTIKKMVYYIGFLYYWNIFGVGFIFYLIGAEIYLGALCPFCTVLHIFQMISMWFAYSVRKSKRNMPNLFEIVDHMKVWIICIGIVNLLPILLFNFDPTFFVGEEEPIITNPKFAQCITSAGWQFFGVAGCGWCGKQKTLFGDTLQFIEFFDCSLIREDCVDLEIDAYPTWIQFDDHGEEINRRKGFISVESWENLTECRRPYS